MWDRANILIVDDEIGPRESLKMVLKPFYHVHTVESGEKALALIQAQPIDLVTLDLKMTGMNGTETLREIKRIRDNIEVIIITGFGSLKTAMDAIRYGAADYILKPFDVSELISVVSQVVSRKQLGDRIRQYLLESRDLAEFTKARGGTQTNGHRQATSRKTIPQDPLEFASFSPTFARFLSEILDQQGSYSTCHSKRVAYYSTLIGQRLRLSPRQFVDLQLGAYLHDIGSIGLDRRLFSRDGVAIRDGIETLRRHTEIGSELIAPLGFSPEVTYIVRYHHERYDGTGSPEGLRGNEIPYLARIVGIAEAFDEAVGVQSGPDHDQTVSGAAALLEQGGGAQFDPQLAQVFLEIIKEKAGSIIPSKSDHKAFV